jgi:hypothetical protein
MKQIIENQIRFLARYFTGKEVAYQAFDAVELLNTATVSQELDIKVNHE